MRGILLATLISLGLAASVQAVTGQVSPNNPAAATVKDQSKSPMSSPIFDCEPTELAALSKEVGRSLCVQDVTMENLNVTGPAIEAAARSVIQHPTGNQPAGDPNAITCRQRDVAFRLPRLHCAYNAYWVAKTYRGGFGPGTVRPPLPPFDTVGLTPPLLAGHQ
jgi:hypothetical protein